MSYFAFESRVVGEEKRCWDKRDYVPVLDIVHARVAVCSKLTLVAE